MDAQKLGGVIWPGAVVLVTGIYAYWVSQQELVSSRPPATSQYEVPDPIPNPGSHALWSRIWEDPLTDTWANHEKTRNDATPDFVSDLRRSQLRELKPVPESSDEPTISIVKNHFRELMGEEYGQRTICLPVLLPGGPYAEDKEKRLRIRYAVVSALTESAYIPQRSSKLDYVNVRIWVCTLRGWVERDFAVPFKRYRRSEDQAKNKSKQQAFVLWINESELGMRPLLAVNRILSELFSEENKDRIRVRIIGPSNSDVLEDVASRVANKIPALDENMPSDFLDATNAELADMKINKKVDWWISNYSPIEFRKDIWPLETYRLPIFSPRATADIDIEDDKTFAHQLYRVIGTDRLLTNAVVNELEQRRITDGRIVLITENDTTYGQQIVESFEGSLNPEGKKKPEERLIVFKMLRGVDGQRPGQKDGSSETKPDNTRNNSELPVATDAPQRRPQGRSQYDYLRRLPERIRQKVADSRAGSKSIAAIGVVGSDVYDKLLVLRALRSEFPNSVFFTTDMDAIYSHPDQLRHTRGLLVASHFGLSLNDQWQKETPSFRDSYQTATFLATRLAADLPFGDAEENAAKSEGEQAAQTNGDATKSGKTGAMTDPQRATSLCNRILKREEEVPIAAVLHVIGKDGAYPLKRVEHTTTAVVSPESVVHPQMKAGAKGWQMFLIVGVTLFAAVVGLILTSLDRLPVWPLFHRGEVEDQYETKASSLRLLLRICIGLPLLLGIVLLVGSLVRFWLESELVASYFGATDTLLQSLLYTAIGLGALACLVLLLNTFVFALSHIRAHEAKIEDYAWSEFQPRHLAQAIILSLVLMHWGVLCACGISFFDWRETLPAWASFLVVLGTLTLIFAFSKRSQAASHPGENWILRMRPRQTAGWGAAAIVVVSSLALLGYRTIPNGWSPVWTTSRSGPGQFVDWLTFAYAFGLTGILFGTLVYCQLWCRLLSQSIENEYRDWLPTSAGRRKDALRARFDADRLRVIAQITAVPAVIGPAMMGLLLMLVMANHPKISPNAMPKGILVMVTITFFAYLLSILWHRFYFHREQHEALSRLEDQPSKSDEHDDHREQHSPEMAMVVVGHAGPETTFEIEAGAMIENQIERQPETKTIAAPEQADELRTKLEKLNTGVFRPWNESAFGWILGGGTMLALVEWWVRWSSTGL